MSTSKDRFTYAASPLRVRQRVSVSCCVWGTSYQEHTGVVEMREPANVGVVRDEPGRILAAIHGIRAWLRHSCGRISTFHSMGGQHSEGISKVIPYGCVGPGNTCPWRNPSVSQIPHQFRLSRAFRGRYRLTSVDSPDQGVDILQRIAAVDGFQRRTSQEGRYPRPRVSRGGARKVDENVSD